MSIEKRKRGRPKGTEINDRPILMKVASLLIDNPIQKPITAFKRAYSQWEERDVRRFQIKWKRDGAETLAIVRALRQRSTTASKEIVLIKARQEMDRAQAITWGVLSGAIQDVCDSPTMQAVREIYDSPTMRAAREIYDSPTMRAMRDVYDSPTMRAMREMCDSPTMRAMREVQATLGVRIVD
jgi:hypothetical protein